MNTIISVDTSSVTSITIEKHHLTCGKCGHPLRYVQPSKTCEGQYLYYCDTCDSHAYDTAYHVYPRYFLCLSETEKIEI